MCEARNEALEESQMALQDIQMELQLLLMFNLMKGELRSLNNQTMKKKNKNKKKNKMTMGLHHTWYHMILSQVSSTFPMPLKKPGRKVMVVIMMKKVMKCCFTMRLG
jgi:hypothetical protein